MGASSGHGQRNKLHKAGRHAAKGARARHLDEKAGVKASSSAARRKELGKEAGRAAARAARDAQRRAILDKRRSAGPPRVVALLPLVQDVDVQALWKLLTAAAGEAAAPAPALQRSDKKGGVASMEVEVEAAEAVPPPLAPCTLSLGRGVRTRITLLPPPPAGDPLAIVDLARCADVVVLVTGGGAGGRDAADGGGRDALAVLRAMGLPHTAGCCVVGEGAGLKDRSAVKKAAGVALAAQVSAETRVFVLGGAPDVLQLLRHVAEHPLPSSGWRAQRPAVMVEAAEFVPAAAAAGGDAGGGDGRQPGLLRLRGYLRGLGLSANGLVHVPGEGDFQVERIEGPPEPPLTAQPRPRGGDAMDTSDGGGGGPAVLAEPHPQQQEAVVREHEGDPLAGEQTWPTEEELADADAEARRRPAKRRLPKGTSAYQAAWILDDDSEGEGSDVPSDEDDDEGDEAPRGAAMDGMGEGGERDGDGRGSAGLLDDEDDGDTDMMQDDESDAAPGPSSWQAARRARQAEAEEELFPDEVDTPADVDARVRFAKFRGLKSWRASAWDPKESLPRDYARVFAFDSFKRSARRAAAAAAAVGGYDDPHGVAAGCYVDVLLRGVGGEAAARVVARVAASREGRAVPLVAVGLLQHESKMSVVHYGVRKAAGYDAPLANKEELLIVQGVRSFPACPIYSGDDFRSDKHKMERFLAAGRPAIASVYAPICFPPMPVLGFKRTPGQPPKLAFTGTVRGCDPDRLVIKKLVLSGYPVKVHRNKAVVKYMFHNPDDIRWFKALELWTKRGRRGRIREPIGTHGSMKCIFDGNIMQSDSVCVSLYKRVYPKWPQDLTFA